MTKNLIIIVVFSFCLQSCVPFAHFSRLPHEYTRYLQEYKSVSYGVIGDINDLERYKVYFHEFHSFVDFDDNIFRDEEY